jgi:hypothetical protein
MIAIALHFVRILSPGTFYTLPFAPSVDFPQNARTPGPTGHAKKLKLTRGQMVVVCTSLSLAILIIIGEGAVTYWYRRRQRGVVPIELEHVMLPSPGDAYVAESV